MARPDRPVPAGRGHEVTRPAELDIKHGVAVTGKPVQEPFSNLTKIGKYCAIFEEVFCLLF